MASVTALASTSTIPHHDGVQPLSHSQSPALMNGNSSSLSANVKMEPSQEPASSQALNSTSAPRIFVYPDGTAIPIFVEANGVSNNRPKLVRSLKRHGANLVHDPAEARIILVEPVSKEGRYFVREWQADGGKKVLDVAWAAASVERGRALMQDDQYGGFGNLSGEELREDEDDYGPDGEEMDAIEVEKCVTPAKLKRKKNKVAESSRSHPVAKSSSNSNTNGSSITIMSTGKTPENYASQGTSHSRSTAVNSSAGVVSGSHHTSERSYESMPQQRAGSAPKPIDSRPSSAQESRLGPSLDRKRAEFVPPGLPTPPGTSSSSSIDLTNYQYPGNTASPSPSQHSQHHFPQPAFTQNQYQPYRPFPLQSYDSPVDPSRQYTQPQLFPQPLQPPSSQFQNQLTLVDRRSMPQDMTAEMQHQMETWASMTPAMQQYFYAQMQGAQMPRALPAPSGFIAPNQTTMPSVWMGAPPSAQSDQVFDHTLHQQNFQQPSSSHENGYGMSEVTPSQLHSFTPPLLSSGSSFHGRLHTPPPSSFSLSSQERGNEPDTPPIAVLEGGSVASSKGKKRSRDMVEANYEDGRSLGSSSSRHRSKKSSKKHRPSPPPAPKKPPIGIFTGWDGNPMKFFYQLITKDRDGKRMSHISKIKSNGGSITSELDDATFIILAPQSPLYYENLKKECLALERVALKSSFIDACVEEGTIVDTEDFELDLSEASPVKKSRGRPSTHSIAFSKDKASDEAISPDLLESLPAPPPATSFGNGTNKYTDGEQRFVLECAAVIFRKLPGVSTKKLCDIIAVKCPSHTSSAWYTHATRNWSEDLEEIRRMVADEPLGAQGGRSDGDNQVTPTHVDVHATQGEDDDDVQEIPAPVREFTADELETDLQNITNYFAGEPQGADEVLWVELTEKHACLTANTWQEFYQNQVDEVNLRLRTALGLTEEDV